MTENTELPEGEGVFTPSVPPTIVRQVTVQTGAIIALTSNNAVFRNGRQLVIPHLGAQFLEELMEALASEDFVRGIVMNNAANYVEETPSRVAEIVRADRAAEANPCGDEHYTGVRCTKVANHEGPHVGWQGGPQDWGGGDEVEWENTRTRESHQPYETNLEGFEVHWGVIQPGSDITVATVYHPNSARRHTFASPESARERLGEAAIDEYERLCAKAYLDWHEAVMTVTEHTPHWMKWKAGDVLSSDIDTHALVVTSGAGIAVVTHEGNVFAVSKENEDIFSHWVVEER
jgi:hypothetical protein